MADGAALVLLTFLIAPIAILGVFCFSASPLLALPIPGLTLSWFGSVWSDPRFHAAAGNSLLITLAVGIVSSVSGTLAAVVLAMLPRRASMPANIIFSIGFMLPPLFLGVSLLNIFSAVGFPLGLWAVIAGHLTFTQPLVIAIVGARLATFDFALLDSARDLGAGRFYVFRTILMPILFPTIVSAAFIAMALSLDDFVVTLFTIGGGSTLPIFMWGMLRRGADPSLNVMAVTIMAMSVIGVVLGWLFAGRGGARLIERRRSGN